MTSASSNLAGLIEKSLLESVSVMCKCFTLNFMNTLTHIHVYRHTHVYMIWNIVLKKFESLKIILILSQICLKTFTPVAKACVIFFVSFGFYSFANFESNCLTLWRLH